MFSIMKNTLRSEEIEIILLENEIIWLQAQLYTRKGTGPMPPRHLLCLNFT